jgi:hypothetical protein
MSQFEFRGGKISTEYRIFDEVAVLAQILAHRTATES